MRDEIKWEIARRSTPYKCGTRQCDLCLSEKLLIASSDPSSLLNKHSELISSCRHRSKFRCSNQIHKIPRVDTLYNHIIQDPSVKGHHLSLDLAPPYPHITFITSTQKCIFHRIVRPEDRQVRCDTNGCHTLK